MSNNDILEFC